MRNTPKILIVTLYSGENELEECIQSIKAQRYTNWENKIFKNLPKREAHNSLYGEFMKRSNEYDLFLKLDADMVLIGNDAFDKIIDLFKNYDELDNAELAVYDWFTDTHIWGVHIFSNRAKWPPRDGHLFTDKDPIIPGIKKTFEKDPAPLVKHCPNPSPFQAYHFGLHRAFKAIDGFSESQFQLLIKVWDNFLKKRDKRLGFVILGAEHVMVNKLKQSHINYTQSSTYEFFEQYKNMSSEELYRILKFRWSNSHIRNIRYNFKIFLMRLRNKLKALIN